MRETVAPCGCHRHLETDIMNWQVEVPIDKIIPTEAYIVAKRWESMDRINYIYYCRGLNQKETFASKPGIAIHVIGDDKLIKLLKSDPKFVALKIPEDHAKRWKARRHRFKSKR